MICPVTVRLIIGLGKKKKIFCYTLACVNHLHLTQMTERNHHTALNFLIFFNALLVNPFAENVGHLTWERLE